MKKETVMVKSEFAPLKKVVLTQSEFIFPMNSISDDVEEVLDEETLQMYKDVDGKNYKEAFPERQIKWEQERENLKQVLEKYGVEVVRPRLLTDYEKESGKEYGCSNFFVRDPFFTIGNNIIEGSLRYHHRRKEILPLINGIPEELKNWDKISVPYSDVSRLAVNGLPINDSVYILDPEFEYIGKQLISKGITVEYIDFEISRSLGGSFRCSTQPLLRY